MDRTRTLDASARPPPSEADIASASDALKELDREARALGTKPQAAHVHYAIGRIFAERLGDPRSAAIAYQNAFRLDPRYRPNLEAARRLFAGAGLIDRAVALHEREEELLASPSERAESLRAQASLLVTSDEEEAARRLERALDLAPEHPALLAAAIEAAERRGDRLETARLLLRAASAVRDVVQKAASLRRAARIAADLSRTDQGGDPDVSALQRDTLDRLHAADPRDPEGILGLLERARAAGDWESILRLYRDRAERTRTAYDRALVANIAAYRLGGVAEAMSQVKAALDDARRDGALLALLDQLAGHQRAPDLFEVLRARAAASGEPTERADLKTRAAELSGDPLEQEQLLSEALAENPGDAVAIALHARLVALRDAGAAADRFVALAEALTDASPAEAASHFVEAGAWLERAGRRGEAGQMARRAFSLAGDGPVAASALRLWQRNQAAAANTSEVADLLERAAAKVSGGASAELLGRAAVVLGGAEGTASRALALAERAAQRARGQATPRWLETWMSLALRTSDNAPLPRPRDPRRDRAGIGGGGAARRGSRGGARRSTTPVPPRSSTRRERRIRPPTRPAGACSRFPRPRRRARRVSREEARGADPARGGAAPACRALRRAFALRRRGRGLGPGAGPRRRRPCRLRRLARVQSRRGDHTAALAVLVQIAQALPEGPGKAEAHARAAEYAEWRTDDPVRAVQLYAGAGDSPGALAPLARLLAWMGRVEDAAEASERLASRCETPEERSDALRWAAALRARTGDPRAADLYRRVLAEDPDQLPAMAALLDLIRNDESPEARKERADLRAKLASRCQDPRSAALLRTEAAKERLVAGEREQAIAEFRRALALNPQVRIALDAVENALRMGDPGPLAEHLAFRCAYAEGDTRAALSVEHADTLAQAGDYERAREAYAQALATDPGSLFAVRGARKVAERTGDKQEQLRLLAREAALSGDPGVAAGNLIEAAILAQDLGVPEEAAQHLTAVLEREPRDEEVAAKLRSLLGDGAPGKLAQAYERVGTSHQSDEAGASAWTRAARIELRELNDPARAFSAAGRALARKHDEPEALELRAEAAVASGHEAEAAAAIETRLTLPDPPGELRLRLGRLYAEKLGDPGKALPLLLDRLQDLELPTLVKLAPEARSLPPADSTRLLRRLLETAGAAKEGQPSRVHLAEWTDELARGLLALGSREEALEAFRKAAALEPRNRAALRHVAELTTPEEAIAAHRTLFEMSPPEADSLHALFRLFQSQGQRKAAEACAAVLAGLGLADAAEKGVQDEASKRPPAEIAPIPDEQILRSAGDEGAVRQLLAAAAGELVRALPTQLAGRGDRVKGDNPVRRITSAIANALGVAEPALYVAKGEPSIVIPTATEPAGLLVGLEVPKRFNPRQQRFLYARALAHSPRGPGDRGPSRPAPRSARRRAHATDGAGGNRFRAALGPRRGARRDARTGAVARDPWPARATRGPGCLRGARDAREARVRPARDGGEDRPRHLRRPRRGALDRGRGMPGGARPAGSGEARAVRDQRALSRSAIASRGAIFARGSHRAHFFRGRRGRDRPAPPALVSASSMKEGLQRRIVPEAPTTGLWVPAAARVGYGGGRRSGPR